MAEPTLDMQAVRKTYGDIVAVDRISLTLHKGEFLTFLGPSGSGKTTMLQMVAGLQAPTSGHILLDGRPIDPLPPHKRNIGVVFQHYALFPHMTVAKNVAFPLEMRKVAAEEARRRVGEALELVGLPSHGERYPGQLSGGQQQRVALARALVFRPPLLLMDEPLGALDKKLREQLQLEIMRLHRELGMSILYVTHDQEEALVMSDRIAVFNAGRIEQVGPAKELYERPVTRFVGDFLGESNFFAARVRTADGAGALCHLDGPNGPMRAHNTAGLAAGAAAFVAVRPERMRLAAADAGENLLEGRVAEIIYLGRSRKYVVRLASGEDVAILQQADEADRSNLAIGDGVRLSWRAEDANVVATGTAG